MQVLMFAIFVIALDRGEMGTVVNTGVALGVTQLVPLLERDYDVPMDPALTLWITTAVFLHAVGTFGYRPGAAGAYQSLWWYDHLTHALSASVVAAVGYSATRAIDLHSPDVNLPSRFMFVFILLFVLAFGVFWEVIEFAITLTAEALGGETILTQYGIEDTMLDLLFNTGGAIVVATWGTAYLTDVTGAIQEKLQARAD
jgi:hypothetical protein